MKWGVRKDDRKGAFNPSKGEGLNLRQRRLYEKSNQAYSQHRAEANALMEKVNTRSYQREDIKRYEKAGKRDIKAVEKYARATGQLSKDAKANIRARKINRGARAVNAAFGMGGALGGSWFLWKSQPVAAIAVGVGAGIGSTIAAGITAKSLHTHMSTIDQYYNDISRANLNRRPIEARDRLGDD